MITQTCEELTALSFVDESEGNRVIQTSAPRYYHIIFFFFLIIYSRDERGLTTVSYHPTRAMLRPKRYIPSQNLNVEAAASREIP
ncbi:MAG: hypothetical protein AAF647_05175 [Pseudomonadota bacterium]